MGAAYKVAALQGHKLSAIQAFYLATLGGARSPYLDDRLGRLAPGYAADAAVLDAQATPLLEARTANSGSLEDLLFVLMTIGDDRAVRATYVAGHKVYDREGGFSCPTPRSASPKRESWTRACRNLAAPWPNHVPRLSELSIAKDPAPRRRAPDARLIRQALTPAGR